VSGNRLNAILGLGVVLLFGIWAGAPGCSGGGGGGEAAIDAGVSDVLPPACVGDWCESVLGPYCDRMWRECTGRAADYDGPQHNEIRRVCIDTIAAALGQTPGDVMTKAQQLADCVAKAKTCADMQDCHRPFRPASEAGTEPEEGDGAPVDAGLLRDVVILPADVVTIPGDDPACVSCATSNCPTESALCFVDSPSTPACYSPGGKYPDPTDCCVDYRACIASCLSVDSTGGATFYQCMLDGCDSNLPKGKVQFDTYRTCVEAKCAGCWGDAGS
jgi:hypothetical protein